MKAAVDSTVDAVAVTTESREISDIVWGCLSQGDKDKVLMYQRPRELAQDHVQVSEVVLFTLRQIEMSGIAPNAIVTLQPTSPFRTAAQISSALILYNLYRDSSAPRPTVVGGTFLDGYYYWSEDRIYVDPVNHNPQARKGRQDIAPAENRIFKENGALYITDARRLSVEGNIRLPPFLPYHIESDLELDNLDDWDEAVKIMEKHNDLQG